MPLSGPQTISVQKDQVDPLLCFTVNEGQRKKRIHRNISSDI